MKNGVDFIYEYSDLNLFQTRAKVLTGKYAGMVVEFGGSYVQSSAESHDFVFDWTLYAHPDNERLHGDHELDVFLKELLVSIVGDRNKDQSAKEKLMSAASSLGVQESRIKIDASFYPYGKASKYKEAQV